MTKSVGDGTTNVNAPFDNSGTVEVQTGTLRFGSSGYIQTAGATILNGGGVGSASTLDIQGGSLSGFGTIGANVSNAGQVSPGVSPAVLYITGNYIQTGTGSLSIELGGTDPGTGFDQLNVTGSTTLAGTLNVSLINSFDPGNGDTFQIISYASGSGSFDTTNLPPAGEFGWAVRYNEDATTLVYSGPDLSIDKSGLPDPVTLGNNITYTVTMTNNGPPDTTGVTLTDTLPGSATFVSASSTQGICNEVDGIVTCSVGDLAKEDTVTVEIVVTTTAEGTITNTASVAGNTDDPNPSNNDATAATAVIQSQSDPYITSFSPEDLMHGAVRALTISGQNFVSEATVTLSRGDRGEPDPGDVVGDVLSLSSDTIEVEFDIVSADFIEEWDVIVGNPDGKTASRPIFIYPAVIAVDFAWDGVQGFPVVPPGSERASYLIVFNIGNEDGLVLVSLYPPEPGLIRLKVGSRNNPIWDSTIAVNKDVAHLLVPVPRGREVSIPLWWGVSPEDVIFSVGGTLGSSLGLRISQVGGVKFGQDYPFSIEELGAGGATRDQVKEIIIDTLINTDCEALRGKISAYYGQDGDPNILDSAVDAVIEQIQSAQDPEKVFEAIGTALLGVPGWADIAQSILDCASGLVGSGNSPPAQALFGEYGVNSLVAEDVISLIANFEKNVKRIADLIRADRTGRLEQRVFRELGNFRGAVTRTQALKKALSEDEPCTPLKRNVKTKNGKTRGAWDPNDKTSNSTFICGQGIVDGETRCVRYFVPVTNAADPIEYIIQFENKKEATEPAENVVVTDVLDSDLEPSTLEVIATSHPDTFSVEVIGNTATFSFTGIQLPPNNNPPEGDGFIRFSVVPQANLPVGAEIRNRASIVFDFNPPIETPEVVHVISPIAEIDLVPEWNLISAPIELGDTAREIVLETIDGSYTAVWAYDPSNSWERYIVGGPDFLNTLTDIVSGKGYWIKMSDAATLNLNGIGMVEDPIDLLLGWNLVGFNSLTAMALADALASIASNYASIWGYDAASGGWTRHIEGGPPFLNDLETLESGRGYWINATAPGPWNLNGGAAAPPSPSVIAGARQGYASTTKPEIPYTIWGSVETDGIKLTDGATVLLKVGDKVQSSYRLGARVGYEAFYVLDVLPNDDSVEVKLCVRVDDTVVEAAPVPPGKPGQITRFDLSVQIPPKVSLLRQNYPNPFNPDTWIPYQLREDTDVRIEIYAATGQLVRTLNLGHKPAGFYTGKEKAAHWDGRNEAGEYVASGVYFYRIEAGDLVSTRKMVIVR